MLRLTWGRPTASNFTYSVSAVNQPSSGEVNSESDSRVLRI
jgi:hypothetical protein